jgi:DNA gyrase subunit B
VKVDPLVAVRSRPGMYIGGTDEAGVRHMLFELVANAFDQYLLRRCRNIAIASDDKGMFTVEDDGPGIPAKGSTHLPPLDALLTTWSNKPTVDGHFPHVHLSRAGLGLSVVNVLSERLEIETVHQGIATRARYSRGKRLGRLVSNRTMRSSGTKVRFRPDPSIFTYQPSSKLVFSPQLADLVYLSPGLTWRFLDEKQEGLSLRERVAQLAHRKSTLVAHARTELDCALGPIDIEVAITWPSSSRPAGIESFVNYRRTDDGGSHIDGMLDGIGKFVGTRKRNAMIEQLVAGVSIVLADVKFGTPLHSRLVTPEVRPVVAATTRCALETFAAREPAAAAALRAMLR